MSTDDVSPDDASPPDVATSEKGAGTEESDLTRSLLAQVRAASKSVSYTHLTLPTTPYV